MIRVGIGGWTYEPWRGSFYPAGLAQKRELEFASRAVTAIEINGTYYSRQKPATFASWAATVPDGFVFTVKASRYCTNRRVLADGAEAMERFIDQGIVELGDKLGPILWQFMETKAFDSQDFGAFLNMLPKQHAGVKLRHAVQPRHTSFANPEFVAMARAANVAIVFGESAKYVGLADVTADFVYARLETAREEEPNGYPEAELDRWAEAARIWEQGGLPPRLNYASDDAPPKLPRETFIFMINGAKVRAPAAAQALIARL